MLNVDSDKVQGLIQEVAEQYILPRFGKLQVGDIHFKNGDDPVTIADKESETELSRRLLDLLPGSKVVGEEAYATNPYSLGQLFGDDPVWIIDPLDGTKAFVSSDPVYGVIVALAMKDQTVAGWLYDPTSKEFVTAELGAGAYFKGNRLSVLPATSLPSMSGILGARIREAYQECLAPKPLGPSFHWMMSACHDYASLVVGEPHFARRHKTQMHFHGTKCTCTPWDMAAGVLIHAEAGGYAAHWDGEPFRPSHYGKGIFSAPDQESWLALRSWIDSFCPIPECRAS